MHFWVCDSRGCGLNSDKVRWSAANVLTTRRRLPSSLPDVLASSPRSLPEEVHMRAELHLQPGCSFSRGMLEGQQTCPQERRETSRMIPQLGGLGG